jgi:hypothetical protein
MYTTSSPEKGILSQKKNGSPYPIIHGSQQRLDVDQETVRHQGETIGCIDSVFIYKTNTN